MKKPEIVEKYRDTEDKIELEDLINQWLQNENL